MGSPRPPKKDKSLFLVFLEWLRWPQYLECGADYTRKVNGGGKLRTCHSVTHWRSHFWAQTVRKRLPASSVDCTPGPDLTMRDDNLLDAVGNLSRFWLIKHEGSFMSTNTSKDLFFDHIWDGSFVPSVPRPWLEGILHAAVTWPGSSGEHSCLKSKWNSTSTSERSLKLMEHRSV